MENLHPLLDDAEGNAVARIMIRLRILMPSLPRSLIARLVTSREQLLALVDREGGQNRPCIIHSEMVWGLF